MEQPEGKREMGAQISNGGPGTTAPPLATALKASRATQNAFAGCVFETFATDTV